MDKIDIAGLKIDALTKAELLERLRQQIKNGQKTWLITPYSEFLRAALLDPEVMQILNSADIAVPDGIGLFWAARYLSIPLTAKSYWGKILQAAWQIKYSLAAIVFYPKFIYNTTPSANAATPPTLGGDAPQLSSDDTRSSPPIIGGVPAAGGGGGMKEKIPGADLVWDLAKLAVDNNLSVYLLGGFGDTPKLAADKLISKSASKLKVAGWSNKNPDNPTIIEDIKKAAPDLLFVAFGPIRQEKWIAKNLPDLPIKLVVGLGGTFDYIAGKQPQPPRFLRRTGLEWLWRLFTQPKRLPRIINATFGLASALWHYKVFANLPLRPNIAIAILNKKNEVLVCQRDPKNFHVDVMTTKENLKRANYWQLPQGGIDGTENLIQAAKREALEETGIKNLEFIKISPHTNTYIWNNAARKFWHNRRHKNIGQVQNIAYFKFLGADDKVYVDHHEFMGFRWVPVDQLDKAIHSERASLTKIVMDDLKDLA